MNQVNDLGKELRIFRVKNDETMQDMAKRLGVTASFLSAIETGKRKAPADLIERIRTEYCLNDKYASKLEILGTGHLTFSNFEDYSETDVLLLVTLREKLKSLSPAQKTKILNILLE